MVVAILYRLQNLLPSPLKPFIHQGYVNKVVVVAVKMKNSVGGKSGWNFEKKARHWHAISQQRAIKLIVNDIEPALPQDKIRFIEEEYLLPQ